MAGWSRPSMVPIPERRAGFGAQPAGSAAGLRAASESAVRRRADRVAGGRGPRPIRPVPGAPSIGRPGLRSRNEAGALVIRTCRVSPPRRARLAAQARRPAHPVRVGLARRPDRRVIRRRRVVALVGVGLVALLAVVALGLLASAARSASVPQQNVSIQVAPGESLWQIARRTAPNADVDAVVERIVAQNGLASAAVGPGQVLSVPSGSAR